MSSARQSMMSTIPTDRTHQHKFLSVDFVTALTLEDCRDYLSNGAQVPGQSITVMDDNSFAIQRTVGGDKPRDIRFWGTLQTVKRGTWVWGTVIETSRAERRRSTYGLVFAVAILIGLAVNALSRNATHGMMLFGGILAILGVIAVVYWRQRHRFGLQVVNWVYETLYIAPERET